MDKQLFIVGGMEMGSAEISGAGPLDGQTAMVLTFINAMDHDDRTEGLAWTVEHARDLVEALDEFVTKLEEREAARVAQLRKEMPE